MKQIDYQILKKLFKNPTIRFLRIAEEIGVSPSTVKKRYEKMEKKVFYPPTIIMDLKKVGFEGKAYLLLKNKHGTDPKLTLKILDDLPNLFLIAETIGKFNFICLLAFRNIKDLKKKIYKIREHPSVERIDIAITEQTDFPLKREFDASKVVGNKIDDKTK
jgi:DNA-binding Lrp family transcriptional regulator